MGAWRPWLFALLALGWGCDGSIGHKDPSPGGRSDDDPPMMIPEPPPSGGGGDTGDGGVGGDGGAGGTGDTNGSGGSGGDLPPVGGPCDGGPLAEPIPNCTPVPVPDTGDLYADCVARINQFRWECQCLPPLERWIDGEACTDDNAEYDSVNGAHASFSAQPCGSGARAQNECPGWNSSEDVVSGCLQAMWDEGPEDGDPNTVNGHYETMASDVYTRVACGFYETPSGDVWGVQNFD
ncbi:MAG: hypothetical protein AAGF92_04800 [Myxococcota bacterium]